MNTVRGLLLALRFALELCALAALAYWGFTTGGTVANVVLGIGAPLLAAVIWGLYVSPKARYGTPLRQAVFEAIVFAAAVVALTAARRPALAIGFGALAAVDSVLVRVVDRDLSRA